MIGAAIPTSSVINSQLVPVYGNQYVNPGAVFVPGPTMGIPASTNAMRPAAAGAGNQLSSAPATWGAGFIGSTPFWVILAGVVGYLLFWQIHYK